MENKPILSTDGEIFSDISTEDTLEVNSTSSKDSEFFTSVYSEDTLQAVLSNAVYLDVRSDDPEIIRRVEEVVSGAETALQSTTNLAIKVNNANNKTPLIDENTEYWKVFNYETGVYELTTNPSRGQGFVILGYYDTLEELKTNVPNPNIGDTYGVGASAPYNIYIWAKYNNQYI